MTRRSRVLSPEERRLWAEIARLVRPLRDREAVAGEPAAPIPHEPVPAPSPPAGKMPRQPTGPRPAAATRLAVAPRPGVPATPPPPPLAPLDRRMMRALGRGRLGVDASLDLHGLTQAAAHARLAAFLRSAQASGHRLVLVVTGRGAGRGDGDERGVLRRQVPHWLRLPDLRAIVSGIEEAGPRQGGEGALYVKLRRPRHLA